VVGEGSRRLLSSTLDISIHEVTSTRSSALDLNLPNSSAPELLKRLVPGDKRARILVSEPIYAVHAIKEGVYASKTSVVAARLRFQQPTFGLYHAL